MYLLKDSTRNDFKGMTIPKQQAIIDQIGSPLIPEEAFDLLQQHTENFKKSDPLAKQADRLLYELWENQTKNKTSKAKMETQKVLDQSTIKTRANARKRRLRLLKLKLELTQKSA